jgi:peptide/nickel transport system permease protein
VSEAVETLEAQPGLRHRGIGLRTRLRRNMPGVIGVCILVFLGLVAAVGPYVVRHDPLSQNAPSFQRPSLSLDHPFGTDRLGRDVLSRVISGARTSLQIGFLAVTVAVLGGCFFGVISGYFGGWVDYLIQRVVEVVISIPALILLIVVSAAVGSSVRNVTILLGIMGIPILTRVARSIIFSEKEQLYIEAARALGASNKRILFVHLFPSIIPLAGILAALALGGMILAEAALSFLGVGVPPPNPSWGADMSGNARDYFQHAPWLAIFPGLALSLTILGANLVAETIRDLIDPYAQRQGMGTR